MSVALRLQGWEDGEPMDRVVDVFDRWEAHGATTIELRMPDKIAVKLHQRPNAQGSSKIGVGACLWEGEILLAAHLAALDARAPGCFRGKTVVELGAGPGAAGIYLAKKGARVLVSDLEKVLPLMQENVELNAAEIRSAGGSCTAAALEWGAPGYERRLEELSTALGGRPAVDFVVAADICYEENELPSPSMPHFVNACRLLCDGATRVIISFEVRTRAAREALLEAAGRAFREVRRVPEADLPPQFAARDHLELFELSL